MKKNRELNELKIRGDNIKRERKMLLKKVGYILVKQGVKYMKKILLECIVAIFILNFIFEILYWTVPVLKNLISSDIVFNISMPINLLCLVAVLYRRDCKRAEAENTLLAHEDRLKKLEQQILEIKDLKK